MTSIDDLAARVKEIEAEISQADMIRRKLRASLADTRKELANARRRAKNAKPVRDEAVRLAEAQHKLRELRVAAANALRKRGATIEEVEAVVGVGYAIVKAADDRLQRAAALAKDTA